MRRRVRVVFSVFIGFAWCIYEDGEASAHSNTIVQLFVRKLFTVVGATKMLTPPWAEA